MPRRKKDEMIPLNVETAVEEAQSKKALKEVKHVVENNLMSLPVMPDDIRALWDKTSEQRQLYIMYYVHLNNKQVAFQMAYPQHQKHMSYQARVTMSKMHNDPKVQELIRWFQSELAKEITVPSLLLKLHEISTQPLNSKHVDVREQIKATEMLLKYLQALPPDNNIQVNIQLNIPVHQEDVSKESEIIEAELLGDLEDEDE
ncbi:MAG: hypothetical protein ACR2MR_13620 [Dietzia maris]